MLATLQAAADEACLPGGEASPRAGGHDAATLALFDRLSGYWRGEGFGGQVEEWWSPRDGSEMHGVFRGSHAGKTDFYEFMKIELEPAPGRQIVRHLDAAGAPWFYRPVDTVFAVLGAENDCLRFEGVSYRFEGTERLTVTVQMEQGGRVTTARIRFERASAP